MALIADTGFSVQIRIDANLQRVSPGPEQATLFPNGDLSG
jgi:hypothetical protein